MHYISIPYMMGISSNAVYILMKDCKIKIKYSACEHSHLNVDLVEHGTLNLSLISTGSSFLPQ